MASKVVGGTTWREELVRARNAQKAACTGLRRLTDERPTPAVAQAIVLSVALDMITISEALGSLTELGEMSAKRRRDMARLVQLQNGARAIAASLGQ